MREGLGAGQISGKRRGSVLTVDGEEGMVAAVIQSVSTCSSVTEVDKRRQRWTKGLPTRMGMMGSSCVEELEGEALVSFPLK
jgi:hypothetical protein